MKTSLTIGLIIATCLSASAASYTWSGAAGTTDWQTGANWVGDTAPTLGSGTAHTINIGNDYTVTNGATLVTYSGSHIFNIGSNSNVTISGQTNDNVGNITLGTGSTFTINQSGFLKMRNPASPSEIFGTLTISGASLQCNDTQGSTPADTRKMLDLGSTGKINITYSFYASGFDIGANIDAYGSANSFQSRILIDAGQSGGAVTGFNTSLFSIKDTDGSLLTLSSYSTLEEFTNAGESTIGTYFVENKTEAKDIVVHWYQGTKPIPEPATASLFSLMGIASLMFRRRHLS